VTPLSFGKQDIAAIVTFLRKNRDGLRPGQQQDDRQA